MCVYSCTIDPMNSPPQILTKDSVTAKVDAVVYFRIADPIAAVIKAENARDSTFRISQSTLRDVLGTKTLSELLAERDVISEQLGVSSVCVRVCVCVCGGGGGGGSMLFNWMWSVSTGTPG